MKVIASEYLDNGQWGVITEDNRVIVPDVLTEQKAVEVAERINRLLDERAGESA